MANRFVKAISQVGTKRRAGFTEGGGARCKKQNQFANKAGTFKHLSNAEVSSLLNICEDNGITPPEIQLEDATMKESYDGDVCLIQESPYRILKVSCLFCFDCIY